MGAITSSELWQEIIEKNDKLGRNLDMPTSIEVEYQSQEAVITPKYKVYWGNVNGKASYMTVGKFEYQIRKLLNSKG